LIKATKSPEYNIEASNNKDFSQEKKIARGFLYQIKRHDCICGYLFSLQAWEKGNEEASIKLFGKIDKLAPNAIKILHFQRTLNWIPKIVEALEQSTDPIAIVMGAMHLFDGDIGQENKKGAISHLRERGFEINSCYS